MVFAPRTRRPAPRRSRAQRARGSLRWLWVLLQPRLPQHETAIASARERISDDLFTPQQTLGRASAGCAATHGVLERCNFSCTACYLGPGANRVPPLPFEDVARQLDTIRRELGPWGNTQITAGEVTLLPVDQLLRILRYCQTIELAPMLMTHGQVLLDDPGYLERLVLDGGLDNMAVHMDSTQRGRPGLKLGTRERELHPMRDTFAELVRSTRRRTGRPLRAAQNVTVMPETLHDVPDVLRWALRNADAFRMLSLQPVAQVGRTQETSAVTREALWQQVEEGLGMRANDRAWFVGHPECSTICLFWVVALGELREAVEVTRRGKRFDEAFFRWLLADLGGWRMNAEGRLVSMARLVGRLLRRPRPLVTAPLFSLYRLWTERSLLLRALRAFMGGERVRLHPFVLVIHRFMQAGELDTELGRQRLAACAFRVPLEGADGEMQMVSMCEMNARGLRAGATAAKTRPA